MSVLIYIKTNAEYNSLEITRVTLIFVGVFRRTREVFTHLETSPLPMI